MRGGRRQNRRGQGAKLAEDLLGAALELLEEAGTGAVTVRGVARRVGIVPQSFYLHYQDRDALLASALRRATEAFRSDVSGAAAAATAPEKLYAAAMAYWRFGLARPRLYAALMATDPAPVTGPGSRWPVFLALEASFPDSTVAETKRTRAVMLWSALHGLVTLDQMLEWGGVDRTQLVGELVAGALRGVKEKHRPVKRP